MTAWCHGAPGIGLARLGGLACLDTPAIRQDISRALECTQAVPPGGPDHLCCGSFGLIEFLLQAARRLDRRDLLEDAQRRTAWIVRRAGRQGWYSLPAQIPGVIANPSFFQGASGIGYALLKLAAPDRLPCVLLWE